MTDIRETLNERGKVHGDFTLDAATGQALKFVMQATPNWRSLSPDKKEALEHIATKIARILTGDPEHEDHWRDICGYSTLAGDRVRK